MRSVTRSRDGSQGAVWRRDVACGSNAQLALVRALTTLPTGRGQVWSLGVSHDDGCPALTGGMPACTCELVQLEARQAA